MSVTFGCPDAPRKELPCPWCERARAEGWAEPTGRCDRFCQGTLLESEAPEVTFAESNASALLRLLGFECSSANLYGECDGATLRQRILRARNTDRSALVAEPTVLEGGHAGTRVVEGEDGLPTIQRMGPTVYMGGNTDERTLERLASLERLALWAQVHDLKVAWA